MSKKDLGIKNLEASKATLQKAKEMRGVNIYKMNQKELQNLLALVAMLLHLADKDGNMK